MATDWIKMRTDIYRDPKVCVMADILGDPDGPLGRHVNQMCQTEMAVTRNALRNVTVGALVTLWGVTRHRGKRNGDDLFLPGCTLNTLDDIADLPGIGEAMVAVGWAAESDDGVRLPSFFSEYNTEPGAKSGTTNAERQRRHREKQKEKSNALRNVTRNALRNDRERERVREREESITNHTAREIAVHNTEIKIPDNVNTPECHAMMNKLFAAMNARRSERGEYNLDDFAIQANWEIAGQLGPKALAAVIPRAIGNDWKSLIVPDNISSQNAAGSPRRSRKDGDDIDYSSDEEVLWAQIAAACKDTTPEGDKARKAFDKLTKEIMTQIGGSAAIRELNLGEKPEREMKKRFILTRRQRLKLDGKEAC